MSGDTVVTLEHWVSPVYRDRWTLSLGGKPLLTFSTESEARAAAERHGWTVDDGDGLEAIG